MLCFLDNIEYLIISDISVFKQNFYKKMIKNMEKILMHLKMHSFNLFLTIVVHI